VLSELLCDRTTETRLGEAGLALVRASLWPEDCQTCGYPLGAGTPVLHIDDFGESVWASLHHRACRQPRWNDDTAVEVSAGPRISWSARALTFPTRDNGATIEYPVLLVNPGLETIMLEGGDGDWHPELGAHLRAAGLVPPGLDLRLEQPVGGAVAHVGRGEITVTITTPPSFTYQAPAHADTLARARELGGILLILTHSVHPGQLTPGSFKQDVVTVLRPGQALAGWVAERRR
jgi:hypothetical protein